MAATYEELMLKSRQLAANGDVESARRVAKIALGRKGTQLRPPETTMVEQMGSGVNEGIAGILGAPIDLANTLGDLPAKSINAVFGTDLATSQDLPPSLGSSAAYRQGMADMGLISETAPQSRAQRYGRRIGQEVGASAIPGGAAIRGASAPARVAAGTTAAAVTSGMGGQTSREILPDSDLADAATSLIAGGLVPAVGHAMTPRPKAPTLDQLKAQRDQGYEAVRQSGATLSQQSASDLANKIEGTFGPRAATKRLNPKAAIAADDLTADLRAAQPTISDVDDIRKWIGDNVAGSREAGEARIGMAMKQGIDDHLANIQPGDVTGTNRPNEVVEALTNAREKAHRIHKSQIFEAEDTGLIEKGLRRAATTGTGGNEVNAIRQNVRRVLETPSLRKGFSEVELQAMRDIAGGRPTQNAMRWMSKFAPSSGLLPGASGFGGIGLATHFGNPLYVAPSIAGEVAKYGAEQSKRRQVRQLGELIRNGKPLPKKEMSDNVKRVAAALMAKEAARVAQGQPEFTGKTREIIDALMARP